MIKLLNLTLEALLVLLILLLVLALNDFLRLLRHPVQLNVKGALLVVLNLESESLDLVFDLLKLGVVFEDELHVVHFLIAFAPNAVIFGVDYVNVYQDCIFVVSGNR